MVEIATIKESLDKEDSLNHFTEEEVPEIIEKLKKNSRFPIPLGCRILVLCKPPEKRIESKIILTGETEKNLFAQEETGWLIRLGSQAFQDLGKEAWAEIGHEVEFIRGVGKARVLDGYRLIRMNDEDLICRYPTKKEVENV